MYPLQAKPGDIPPVRLLCFREIRELSWEIKNREIKNLSPCSEYLRQSNPWPLSRQILNSTTKFKKSCLPEKTIPFDLCLIKFYSSIPHPFISSRALSKESTP